MPAESNQVTVLLPWVWIGAGVLLVIGGVTKGNNDLWDYGATGFSTCLFANAAFCVWFGYNMWRKKKLIKEIPEDDGTVEAKVAILTRDIETVAVDMKHSKHVIAWMIVYIVTLWITAIFVPNWIVIFYVAAATLLLLAVILPLHLKRLKLLPKIEAECWEQLNELKQNADN